MRIEVKHYKNQFENKDWLPLLEDFGESNTDTSTYRPDISIARAQAAQASGKRLVYDFDDGKDTGESVMTFIRNKSLDVTEVDSALDRVKALIDEKTDSDKKATVDKAKSDKVDKMIDTIINQSNESQNSPNSQQNNPK